MAQIREAKKAEYERAGAKLTYLSFILKAAVDALRAVPVVNASVDGDTIVYHKDVNVGIAVALDWGLDRSGHQERGQQEPARPEPRRGRPRRACSQQAAQARRSVRRHVHDHQSQACSARSSACPSSASRKSPFSASATSRSAPIVIDDAIAIRPMAYLSIGYDHRIIDGAVADEFMSHIKRSLEHWDPASV